ncbi:MAG TPA: ABC transporter permease, partial [Gammaproteobacteria bacterium]|nr:ABC transporter permease [Gammaproteobacteria bacterium]
MKSVPWSLAGRLLARDWRSGEILVLLAALVVSVSAMSAVTFFTDRVRQAVSQEAGESLASDLRLHSSDPLPPEYFAAAREDGVDTATIVHFRSVVVAGESSSLAD